MRSVQSKKPGINEMIPGFIKILGGVLLSHSASRAVPSALKSLTSVFGMGTGVSSSPSPPKNLSVLRQIRYGQMKTFRMSCQKNG